MAGDIRIQRGQITDFGASEDTALYTMPQPVLSVDRAFVLYQVTSNAGSGVAAGSTQNWNNDDIIIEATDG